MDYRYNSVYKDKKVFITGHTGFKGSWLSLWLTELGANVIGYSLKANTEPNHYDNLNLNIISIIDDIRDKSSLQKALFKHQPDIVFHLAAQPLVRYSYQHPIETFETNIMGTVNLFEAIKHVSSIKAVINITSDKAYENKESEEGYKETDSMGGYDPYSASKGCSEIITSSYRNSFFNLNEYGKNHHVLVASARAGNVIGGGDWAEDRLIPDIIKSMTLNKKVEIRSPNSIRPWQHVLEPLSGYLLLGKELLEGKKEYAEAWNFGPSDESTITVKEVVEYIRKYWDKINYMINEDKIHVHEAKLLKLNCSKARSKLGWKPKWNSETTFKETVNWYKEFYENNCICSKEQLIKYIGIT